VKTLSVTQPATDEYVSKLDAYFDAACKKPYFEADIKVKVNVTSATLSFTETGTYFRPNGKVLGKLTSSNRFSAGTALDTIVSLGKFAPVGGQAVADLGFICGIPASGTSLSINCQSGVAQTFKSLKLSIASLVPFTLTAASNATAPKVTFKGTASDVRTGPEGSLTITAPSQGELGIGGGGTVYTSTALSGSEGKFALFPAAPTSLSVTDTKGEAKFAYTVLNKTTRAADSTVEGITSRKRLATSATDATGTGTVKYSDGTSAAIRGFLAAD
jgi:hypothetical protein